MIHVEIPAEYVNLCHEWAGGTDCTLRAISSTGELTVGTVRPYNDDGRPMTDEEWHIHLFECLGADLYGIVRQGRQGECEDFDGLRRFEDWAGMMVDHLRATYGLTD